MSLKIQVFWEVTPRHVVNIHRRLQCPEVLLLGSEGEGNTVLSKSL